MGMPKLRRGERGNSGVSAARHREVWRLVVSKGWAQREAARTMNVSHTLVGYYIRKGPPDGWHPPKPKPPAEVIELRPRAGKQQHPAS